MRLRAALPVFMAVLAGETAFAQTSRSIFQAPSRPPAVRAVQSAPQPPKVEVPVATKGVKVSVPAVYPAGSIVIVNNDRHLFYMTGAGEAIRYRVAVGNTAQLWMGRTFVAAKMTDPKWIPVNGDDPVEGGDPKNPLGKRALYLDWSLLRIHGTPSRSSIGSATSNGCVRMLNEDVVDLFERVHLGAPVYAIESWKKATRFEETKVAQKIYANPDAHKEAEEELKEQLAELAKVNAEREKEERRLAALGKKLPPNWQSTRSALGAGNGTSSR